MKNTLYVLKFFLAPILVPSLFYISLTHTGAITHLPFFFVFVGIPLLDLLFPPSMVNPTSKEEENELLDNSIFNILAWSILPIMLCCVGFFLYTVYHKHSEVDFLTLSGWTISLGLACGILGINVGHELGHRESSWQRFLGKGLLWTSLRMSFYIEHNWGHHKDVSTPEDPASAKKGENVYLFIPKSIFLTWLNAWKVQKGLLENKGKGFFSIENDVFWAAIIQWSTIAAVFAFTDLTTTAAWLCACIYGMMLLEMVNYIEHYGLTRKKKENGRYERTLPIHSWNSNHSFSGAALFNLSRHSDHHFIASREYQILRNYPDAPNMPQGYAGMIVLSWIPPLWFNVMNPKLKQLNMS
ncbi:MAG: alkane 1-monooxygenase [Flavobacteriaceae bacterium]|nr:MAG: alkane 1-monooxygenase [Flavobacteriaceae bacterium]